MEKFKFKKNLGQNFLQDEKVLQKIVSSIECSKDDCIIEIGPGHGALTKYLVKFNCPVITFEIDKEVKPVLDKINADNLRIVYEDFMNINLDEFVKNYNYENIYVIANIPYYITTPIIEKITFSNIKVKSLLLMVQKEVADRLSSNNGNKEYGYITVLLNAFYDINKLFNVNRNSFYPVPNVDSAIIKLDSKECNILNFEKFNKLIKNAFRFKRKTWKNNLVGYDLNLINNILGEYGYSLSNRAEDIPVDVYIKLSNELTYQRYLFNREHIKDIFILFWNTKY